MNRKRGINESFKAYRADLKAEAIYFKAWIRGRTVYSSMTIRSSKDSPHVGRVPYRNPERAEKKRLRALFA